MANKRLKLIFWCLFIAKSVAPILSEELSTVTLSLDLTVTSPNGSTFGPIVALPTGGVLVVDQGQRLNKVMKLDQHGKVVPPVYTCRTYGQVTGLMLNGDILYVIQWHGSISKTRLSRFNRTENDWRINYRGRKWGRWQGHRSNLYPGFLLGRELYLLDAYNYFVLSFRPRKWRGRKTVRTTGLHYPVSLTRAMDGEQELFIISLCCRPRLTIYNSTWDLVKTINVTGSPRQVLSTPWSTILVVMPNENRIAEYSLSGVFIRDLLTSRDGLYKPKFISFKQPFLWVTQGVNGTQTTALKRYRFQE